VRPAVQEGVHESPTDSRPPSSASHSDADQLEVPSAPCLVDLRLQHFARPISPPLPELAGVAMGEANQRVGVVTAAPAAGRRTVLAQRPSDEGKVLPERRTGRTSERARSVLPSTDPVRST